MMCIKGLVNLVLQILTSFADILLMADEIFGFVEFMNH